MPRFSTPGPVDPETLPSTGPHPLPARKTRRNGKIAHLPKLQRDMVSRMIYDAVPYERIVFALKELDVTVTVRNVSNWATRGGYADWRLEQQHILEERLEHDALIDHLRHDEPSQLSEVGLQSAAASLSQLLISPEFRQEARQNPQKLAHVVPMLCRINREILRLQQYRDSYPYWTRVWENREVVGDTEAARELLSGQDPRAPEYKLHPPSSKNVPRPLEPNGSGRPLSANTKTPHSIVPKRD